MAACKGGISRGERDGRSMDLRWEGYASGQEKAELGAHWAQEKWHQKSRPPPYPNSLCGPIDVMGLDWDFLEFYQLNSWHRSK